jgi:hypothetical protein
MLLSSISCGSDTPADSAARGSAGAGAADFGFAAQVQPLINAACNCHQSTPILMAPFSLKPGEAYANLINRPSMDVKTMVLVKPGSLNESYLWLKVNGTQAQVGGTGTIMPPTVPLNAQERTIFERWIAGGAKP